MKPLLFKALVHKESTLLTFLTKKMELLSVEIILSLKKISRIKPLLLMVEKHGLW